MKRGEKSGGPTTRSSSKGDQRIARRIHGLVAARNSHISASRAGWLAGYEHIDRAAYIRAATLLAFRRHQARRVGSGAAIDADVQRLRKSIREMLVVTRV